MNIYILVINIYFHIPNPKSSPQCATPYTTQSYALLLESLAQSFSKRELFWGFSVVWMRRKEVDNVANNVEYLNAEIGLTATVG